MKWLKRVYVRRKFRSRSETFHINFFITLIKIILNIFLDLSYTCVQNCNLMFNTLHYNYSESLLSLILRTLSIFYNSWPLKLLSYFWLNQNFFCPKISFMISIFNLVQLPRFKGTSPERSISQIKAGENALIWMLLNFQMKNPTHRAETTLEYNLQLLSQLFPTNSHSVHWFSRLN